MQTWNCEKQGSSTRIFTLNSELNYIGILTKLTDGTEKLMVVQIINKFSLFVIT
jgi:hypothetical protein